MKLSKDKDLQICPIKRLYFELDENLPDRKTIAILLSMEDVRHSNLNLLDAFHKVSIYDTEIKSNPFSFSIEEGVKIKAFLKKESDFERIYVCCDSGESRSTALAAAIMRFYGRNDKEIWSNPHYHPNILVYKNQLNAFGIQISGLRLKYLMFKSKRALKKAINKRKKLKTNSF